jgi:uroporphyrinogen-III decarboxylase
MRDLIRYLLQAQKRLVSPVGGGSRRRFERSVDIHDRRPEERIARWLAFQHHEYGHHFVSATMPTAVTCRSMGFKTRMSAEGVEALVPGQISGPDDLRAILKNRPWPSPAAPYIDCIGVYRALADGHVGGAFFGPFTLAGALLGLKRLMLACRQDPVFLNDLLETFTSELMATAQQCQTRGARFLWVAEPVAVMVSPDHFTEYVQGCLRRIFRRVTIPGFLHIPGDTHHLLDGLPSTGAQCLSLDAPVDMRYAAQRLPIDVVLLGNVHSKILLQDPPEKIQGLVAQLNREMQNLPNFIVSSGGGVSPDTPEENIRQLFRVTEAFPVHSRETFLDIDTLWRAMVHESMDDIASRLTSKPYPADIVRRSHEEAVAFLSRNTIENPATRSDAPARIQALAHTLGDVLYF